MAKHGEGSAIFPLMSELSPALQRICTAATTHFAENGYEGASLSTIAAMVGIRKASLYSHVAGKDALFLLCLQEAIATEKAFVSQMFEGEVGPEGPGAAYALALGDRFENSIHLRLVMRAAFLPPDIHRTTITQQFECLSELLRQSYLEQFQQVFGERFTPEQAHLYASAYQGILDSMCVELQYATRTQMQVRYTAMWRILSDSIQLQTSALR